MPFPSFHPSVRWQRVADWTRARTLDDHSAEDARADAIKLSRLAGGTEDLTTKDPKQNQMKKLIILMLAGLSAVTLLNGCIVLSIGGGTTSKAASSTVGQQLADLQRAKDAGAITDAEYQAQKAKVLGGK